MPTTRQQAAREREVGVYLTLDDVARRLTRVSGSLHSIANLVNDTVESRPGFFAKFRRAGENSSANARAIWRYHDSRWKNQGANADNDDNEDESDAEEIPIDDEVDERIGQPFSFSRAVEVAIGYMNNAMDKLRERKGEMEAWSDDDGALFLQAFIDGYQRELDSWATVAQHLSRCSTYMGESILDTSLRHGWL